MFNIALPRLRRPSTSKIAATALSLSCMAGLTHLTTVSAAADESVLRFAPVADTFVSQRSPERAYGSDVTLRTSSRAGDNKTAYVRFDVAGVPAGVKTTSKLVLQRDNHHLSPSSVSVWSAGSSAWDESTTTASSAPASQVKLAQVAVDRKTTIVSSSLGNAVTGNGAYTFAIRSSAVDDVARFVSREGGSRAPVLEIRYTSTTTAPTIPPAPPTSKPPVTPTTPPTTAKPPTTTPPTTAKPPTTSGIWKPTAGISWQIQLTGKIDTSHAVSAYDIDGFDNTASTVSAIHAKGARAICYVSGGSYEDWRPDAKSFPAAVLGKGLDGWPGEKWLDVRNHDKLLPIMEARVVMCKQKGFDAVDYDNVDGYSNATGFSISAADQIAYNKALAGLAHKHGLAAILKNDAEQIAQLEPYYEGVVVEQCFEYDECDLYTPFIRANKPVLEIEYDIATSKFCPDARAMKLSALKKDLDLGPARQAC